jgi:capsular exopolysaccharide synthesis family protein
VQQNDDVTGMGPGILEAVWQYRWLVAAVGLLSLLAGYGASFLQPTMYQAEARLLLADPRNAGVFADSGRVAIDPSRYVRNQAQFVTSRPVMIRTAESLDSRVTVNTLTERVTAQPSVDLDLITVRALDPTAAGAAAVANAISDAYQAQVADEVQGNARAAIAELEEQRQQLQARIDQAEAGLDADPENSALRAERDAAVAQLITINGRADQIAVDAALYGYGVELFEAAEVPERPAQPQPLRNAAVAMVLGLMAAGAFAWWRAENTQSADKRQDPAAILRAPLLGEIPDFREHGVDGVTPTESMPKSAVAESYQFVVAALEHALDNQRAKTVLITSASPADGKTVTTLNLCIAAMQDGRSMLLIDADERARGMSKLAEAPDEHGLTSLRDDRVDVRTAIWDWRISPSLTIPFAPAGPYVEDPAGFFRTVEFRDGFTRIKQAAEFVIVDSPPLLAVSDTSAVASQVDGIVLVVSKGTPMKLLESVRERLDFIGTPLLGYVFNKSTAKGSGYGYGYGYGYGQDAPAKGRRRPRNDADVAAPGLEAAKGQR